MLISKSRPGFTIVELLIVIVVIAILATITTISFSGIQRRAQNTATIAGVKQAVTAIEAYYAANGSYPLVKATNNGADNACLGEYPDSTCGSISNCSSAGVTTSSSYLNSQMQQFLQSPLPSIKYPTVTIEVGGCIHERWGVVYTVGCYLLQMGGPGAYEPVYMGIAATLNCFDQAYRIDYAAQGDDATVCGLANADDLTDGYRYITNDPNVVPAGWRMCSVHGGRTEAP